MDRPEQGGGMNRRQFLQRSAAAGVMGVATAYWAATETERPLPAAETNPFAYDISRLVKTDPKLVQYEQVGRMAAPHEEVRRMAIGPGDQLLLAAGQHVTVLDQKGTRVFEIALTEPARCVAAGPEGEILVGVRDHLEVFDNKARHRAAWISPGARTWLTGVSATTEGVFLADAGNRVVLRCDWSGQVLARIGEKSKARNIPGFIVPSPYFDLKMHPDGLLRVANPGRHRVEAYTVAGDLELAWGVASNDVEGFCGCCNPIRIALLPDGRIVTCEKGLPRVKVYHADGAFDGVVAGPESFRAYNRAMAQESSADELPAGLDVAVDSAGRIYILDGVNSEIRIMARRADVPRSLTTPKRTKS